MECIFCNIDKESIIQSNDMRANAEKGTARSADIKGYYVGGKTGTSEKVINGRYAKKRVLNAFTAILPADNPKYQLLIMLASRSP